MKVYVGTRTLIAKTCIGCGALKQAQEFARVMQDYYHSLCHKCKNLGGRAKLRSHQQSSHRAAVRHRQPWTGEEITHLKEMAEKGVSGPEMAHTLNRTLYSVYTMKNKLKVD